MENKKRLIDANALRKKHCAGCDTDIQIECLSDPVCASLMWVDQEPTVDAVEVVHAKAVPVSSHIDEDDTYIHMNRQCNKCDALINQSDNYCPNCGARMDGDEKNA